jgi:multidrug efflux pump subunit AcrB
VKKHPFITWFASNSVVANILMFTILGAGIFTALNVRKEGFPAFAAETVTITVPIRGGTPENVERGVSIRIEESLESVAGIDEIRSVSTDSLATVTVQAVEGYPIEKLLGDIKVKVDAIPSLPEQAEKPVVVEKKRSSQVLWVEIYGSDDEALRKEIARQVRDKLLAQPAISKVETFGARDYEISIEPSEEALRRYGLTFQELAQAVEENSVDLGGGDVRSARGDISLRARDQAYRKADFENLPVRTDPDGSRIFVRDVATVRDGFVDQKFLNRFRGEPTTSLQVVTEGNDDIIEAVDEAREVVENFKDLPEGIKLDGWLDGSLRIKDRLGLLWSNGLIGTLLVLVILMLFLNLRLAFWVAVGIPVSLAGAVTLFPIPGIDLSVNIISAFGFLVVLGILVDDAIVIGESIYSEKEAKGDGDENAIETTVIGVSKVVTPATFGVLTTIAAFLPLTQVSGRLGNVFGQIATVVIFCLIFSLIESKLVLPAHLAHLNVHTKPKNRITKAWARFQKAVSNGLNFFIRKFYMPAVAWAIPWRYAVLAAFVAMLILVIGLFPAGQLRFVIFPNIYNDDITANLSLEQGQSPEYLHEQAMRIESEARKLGERYKKQFGHDPFLEIQVAASTNTEASIAAQLTRSNQRPLLQNEQIVQDWRKMVGGVVGARSLTFKATAGPPGGDIAINLESDNLTELEAAAAELRDEVASYPGTFDVSDSFNSGKPEILYSVTPEGEAAGLTRRDLALAVRDAFYGREAQRVQRGRDEVRVMVRYPLEQRGSLETLREMRVRAPDGTAMPFTMVADTSYGESLASIERINNRRVVTLNAFVNKSITTPDEITGRLEKDFFPKFLAKHPSIEITESGEVEQRKKSVSSLLVGFLFSIAFIYVLIAIPLKSYVKPLIIMSVIPFGIIGALMGHVLLDMPISILSVFGILALSGVVVNDSLVLVCAVSDLRAEGKSLDEAVRIAGVERFRAILLTSLTTFFGLAPLLLETEVEAQFLKPMAASLAFGVAFATLITLFLLPALYIILDDLRRGVWACFGKSTVS